MGGAAGTGYGADDFQLPLPVLRNVPQTNPFPLRAGE